MSLPSPSLPPTLRRPLLAAGMAVALLGVGLVLLADPTLRLAWALLSVCVALWLAEAVPPFVPTLLLLAGTPLLLGGRGEEFGFARVLTWPVEPVLCLFFAGMTFDVAARRHHLDAQMARQLLRAGKGRAAWLVAGLLAGTALLSMWLSNVAAAALMLATAKPILGELPQGSSVRRAALLAIAFGGNFGGMATPIGSGPNGLAIAAAAPEHTVTFLHWMAFAVPLTVGMLAVLFGMLWVLYPLRGAPALPVPAGQPLSAKARAVAGLIVLAAVAWLSEPLHGVPAALVGLLAAAALFASGLLRSESLREVDWGTLGLIAGGVTMGKLVERAGFLGLLELDAGASPLGLLVVLVAASALLSSVMSNTATSALLIPVAMTVYPGPIGAILVALAASFGTPFVISTPQNALVYGEGGLHASDFLRVGLPLMVLGCLLLVLTGPWVLGMFGLG